MEYVYATLMLNETGEEINETNLTATLEAAGATITQSRVKALVASLEGVNIDDVARQAGIAPESSGARETNGGGEGPTATGDRGGGPDPDDAGPPAAEEPDIDGADEAASDDVFEEKAGDDSDHPRPDGPDEADDRDSDSADEDR